MIKAEILEALSNLSREERREIRAKLNELDSEQWFDNGELSVRQSKTCSLDAAIVRRMTRTCCFMVPYF